MFQLRIRYYIQLTGPGNAATAPVVQETVVASFADWAAATAAAAEYMARGVVIGSMVYPVALVGIEEL